MYNQAPEAGLASLLASRGRNGDSVLVHMTPDELSGLQSLAYAAGGQLTINPETGLPEANFLKKLLPAIAGFALNAIAPGIGTAIGGALGLGGTAGTALLVGGTTALIEGDLKKGLMAGLGAYGGASLQSGLKSAGEAAAKAAAESGQKAVLSEVAKEQAAQQATELGLTEAATAAPSAFTRGFTAPSVDPFTGAARAATVAPSVNPFTGASTTTPALANVGAQELGVQAAPSYLSTPPSLNYADAMAAAPVPKVAAAAPTFMSGIKALATPEGRGAFGQALGGGYKTPTGQNVSKYAAIMGLTDALSGAQEEETGYTPEEPMFYIPGARNPLYGKSVDQPYFLPGRYVRGLQNFPGMPTTKPLGMADGGSTSDALKAYYESLLTAPSTAQADARRSAVEQYVQQVSQNVQKPISAYYPPGSGGGDAGGEAGGGDEGGGRGDIGDRGDIAGGIGPGDIAGGIGPGGIGGVAGSGLGNVGSGRNDYGLSEIDVTAKKWEDLNKQNLFERIIDKVKEPSFYLPAIGGALAGPVGALIGNAIVPDSGVKVEAAPEVITPEAAESGVVPIREGRPGRSSEGGGGMGASGGYSLSGAGSSYASAIPTGTYSGGVFDLETGKLLFKRAGGSIHGYAAGGLGSLSGAVGPDYNFGFSGGGTTEYAAGGKYLNGPGDGMSDDIEANIEGRQEARLADGEFVVPADVVSHLGNGSSNAGAKKLHVMMDRVRKARTGRERQAPEIDADKYLPA